MSKLETLTSRLDDWINPIVVKELRQVVRGRLVPLSLILYLVVLMLVMGIGITSIQSSTDMSAGRGILFGFIVVFAIVAFILIPSSLSFLLGLERNQENIDLVYITTLPAYRIISGKLSAGLVQVLLFLFAVLPFMTTTYLLRGIDIPTVFVLMSMALLVATLHIQWGLTVAVLPINRLFKGVLGLATLFLYFVSFFIFLQWAENVSRRGVSSSHAGGFWVGALVATAIISFTIVLLFLVSVALVKPASANRARPVRIFLSITWLVSYLAVAFFTTDKDAPGVWAVLCLCVCFFVMFAGISEREELGHRVCRTIPNSFPRKQLAFLHYSGNASGIAWSILALAGTVILLFLSDIRDEEFLIVCLGLALFTIAYSLSGHFLYRTYFHKRLPRGLTWVLSLGLLFILSVGAWMVSFFIYPNSWDSMTDSGWLHLFNPFALGKEDWWPLYLTSSGGWCLIMFVLEARWFFERWRAFRPLEWVRDEGQET